MLRGNLITVFQGETKEDFGWLVAEQAPAAAQPVLSSKPDFSQAPPDIIHLHGLRKCAQRVLSPQEETEGWKLSAQLVPHVHRRPPLACVPPAPKEASGPCKLFEVL